MERYRIEVGRKDGVKPSNIVGAVANEAGIDGEFIGPIKIHDSYSTIDLPEGMPRDIYQTLQHTWVAGKELQLSPAGEESSESRPATRQQRPSQRKVSGRKTRQFRAGRRQELRSRQGREKWKTQKEEDQGVARHPPTSSKWKVHRGFVWAFRCSSRRPGLVLANDERRYVCQDRSWPTCDSCYPQDFTKAAATTCRSSSSP